jgi:Homeodomain-like domain-containing protein
MTAFDESQRPISTVDFVPPPEPNEKDSSRHDRFQEAEKIWEWFILCEKWILSGRTARSWEIRREIVRKEIEGGVTISEIARRFGVTRQSVHQHLCELRNLTVFIGKDGPKT